MIGLPRSTFRSIGKRQAYAEERAYLNLMRWMPKTVLETERIVARVEKDVSCTKLWLESFDENEVRPADIWKRWTCQCSKLRELNDTVVAIECRDPTIVVARGLANTSLIARLLCDYSELALGKAGELFQIELANGGLYAMSKFARKHCSWCVGLEDIVLLAMDFNRKGQAAFEGRPIQSEFRKNPEAKLDFYIGKPIYDFKEDSDLLEWCTIGEPLRETLATTTSQHFGKLENKWRTSILTQHLRVPLLYQIGGCATWNAGQKLDQPLANVRQCNASWIKSNKRHLKLELTLVYILNPKRLEPRLPADKTFDLATQEYNANFSGYIRTQDVLGSSPFRTHRDYFGFTANDAVIAVARIALDAESGQPGHPSIQSLILMNAHGRVLGLRGADNGWQQTYRAPGTKKSDMMHPREELRRFILEHLGRNGVLVGFNIGWLLTAVRLPVPAFRVVDLGLEPTFQQFVLQLANDARDFNGFFDVPRRVSFDRRWPAVLFKSGQSIDFYPA